MLPATLRKSLLLKKLKVVMRRSGEGCGDPPRNLTKHTPFEKVQSCNISVKVNSVCDYMIGRLWAKYKCS